MILHGCRKIAVLNSIRDKTRTIKQKGLITLVVTNNAVYQCSTGFAGYSTVIRLKKLKS